MSQKLPTGWVKTTLGEVCAINPRTPFDESVSDHTEVSFVPMAAVEEESGRLDASQIRALGSVRKGYTSFQENDVIFAKITPCMENGKIALATGLKNGLAYGSTEFFVFRPDEGVLPRFILYFMLQSTLREDAARQMTGASGQKRVPRNYLFTQEFWLPPTLEQKRIVSKLDASLSKLERAEIAAHRAQERLRHYHAAVLDTAVTGELTHEWRKGHKLDETGARLLQRLLKARRIRWEEAELEHLREAGKSPKDAKWKSWYPEPTKPKTADLPQLPKDWTWASLDELLSRMQNGISTQPREKGGLATLRISAVRPMFVDLRERRYFPKSFAKKFSNFALNEGDLLFTRYNGSRELAGVCGRVPALNEMLVHPDKLIRCVVVSGFEPLDRFLEIASNCGVTRRKIADSLRTTAGQWGISGAALRTVPIPLPPIEEQNAIVREVQRRLLAANRLAETLTRQLERARVTQQSLLREAFSGDLISQNPNDEPASVLLERIRAARTAEAKKPKGKRMSKSKSKPTRRFLLDVLREHKKPMTPEQLFREAGFQPAQADLFYRELVSLRKFILEKKPSPPEAKAWPHRALVLLELKEG